MQSIAENTCEINCSAGRFKTLANRQKNGILKAGTEEGVKAWRRGSANGAC